MVKVVEVKTAPNKLCVGRCGEPGKWRYATRDYLCAACAQRPPHQLITRSRAKTTFGLTFADLHRAFQDKRLRMFTVKNFHDMHAPPIRLYYYHEVEALAAQLKKTRETGNHSRKT